MKYRIEWGRQLIWTWADVYMNDDREPAMTVFALTERSAIRKAKEFCDRYEKKVRDIKDNVLYYQP